MVGTPRVNRVQHPIDPGVIAPAPMHLGDDRRRHDDAIAGEPSPFDRGPSVAVAIREGEDSARVQDESPALGQTLYSGRSIS